ncbi:hypothetical protein DFP73DRAFT_592763 [Morchella snyderi]|nr:hypothetical protein DFP73DRAFT_592763 [Morchella snyderi]
MDCSDTVHHEVIHEYSESSCAACLTSIPGDDRRKQIDLAEQAVKSLFYTRCVDQSDRRLLDWVLRYYKLHSFPGHECEAPYHCYGQCPKKYYTYSNRTQQDIASMPPSLRLQLYGSGTYLDHAANTIHIREGKCPEGIFNADLYPYANVPLVSRARNRPEFYQNPGVVNEEEGSPYGIWDTACRAGSTVPRAIQSQFAVFDIATCDMYGTDDDDGEDVKETVKDNEIVSSFFKRLSGFFRVFDKNEEA